MLLPIRFTSAAAAAAAFDLEHLFPSCKSQPDQRYRDPFFHQSHTLVKSQGDLAVGRWMSPSQYGIYPMVTLSVKGHYCRQFLSFHIVDFRESLRARTPKTTGCAG